jgi:hypothetical protein
VEVQSQWFGPTAERKLLLAAGFKMDGGGPHQSKTMMLRELCTIFAASGSACPESLIVEQNVLGKPTARARSVALHRLKHGARSGFPNRIQDGSSSFQTSPGTARCLKSRRQFAPHQAPGNI